MESLTEEVAQLKYVATETLNSNDQQTRMVNLDKQVKKLNDLWEKNLTATSSIKNAVDQVFIDINVAEQRANEVDNHLQRLKTDLKNYYNSAFFKEDSRLIREMHKTLCKDAAERASTTPPPESRLHTPIRTPDFPLHPTQSVPPTGENTDLQSKRGSGFSMTPSLRPTQTSDSTPQLPVYPVHPSRLAQHSNDSREQPSRRGRGISALQLQRQRPSAPQQTDTRPSYAQQASLPASNSQQAAVQTHSRGED
jgi:hypothetical protein